MAGRVSSLPQQHSEQIRFRFELNARHAELTRLPARMLVRWYQPEFTPEIGDELFLKLRVHPPRSIVNFQGRDRERSYYTSGVSALGLVLEAQKSPKAQPNLTVPELFRFRVRQWIKNVLPADSARAIVMSLALADRSELSVSNWKTLQGTGTGHLLAISGLHIGLAGVFGFWIGRIGLALIFGLRQGGTRIFLLSIAGALVSATIYSTLADFPVSTLRALLMLIVATVIMSVRKTTGNFIALALAFLVVVLANAPSLLTAGFWLSFGAVIGLLVCFSPGRGVTKWWASLPRAQLAVMAVTIPLGAFWFQSGTWLSMPANLIAIPLVSFLTVPLILTGLLFMPLPWLSEWFFEIAHWTCVVLLAWLQTLTEWTAVSILHTPQIGLFSTVIGILGGILLLLPRGVTIRWMGLCLLLTLFLPRAPLLRHGEYSVESLDVGQGLAILVRTKNHNLLYDTGPGDGLDWDLFDGVIGPALASDGHGDPDRVAVSHADLDHAGGMASVLARFGDTRLMFNPKNARPGEKTCVKGERWEWDGVRFEVLHPSAWLPYLGNDSSCVISVDNGQHKSLLTGDIGKSVEKRLADDLNEYYLMTAPHHGSHSSSGREILEAARPAVALVSAGYDNRFGFPRPEVLSGYEAIEALVLSTIDCGAIRISFYSGEQPHIRVARNNELLPWRWMSKTPDCLVTQGQAMYHLERPNNKE